MEEDSATGHIMNAILTIKTDNAVQRKASVQLLSAWFNQPNFPTTTMIIIQNEANDPKVRHATGVMLIRYIIDNWLNMNEADRLLIKHYFYEQVTNKNLSDELSYIFKRIISLVALYEYPENWPAFLVDILYIPPNSDHYVPSMQLLAQFTFEVARCNFLTSDRVIRLQQLILTFLDLYLPNIQILLSAPTTTPFAISLITSLLSWGKAPEILTTEIFSAILTNITWANPFLNGTINCLSIAFFGRNDVFPMFSRMPQLIKVFANLTTDLTDKKSQSTLVVVAFVSRFLFKYLKYIESLYENDKEMLVEITGLFEATLLQDQCDDFWRLWRSILHKVSSPITEEPTISFIQPIIPLICEKMAGKLEIATEFGRIKNIDAHEFFDLFIKKFHTESIDYLKNTQPSLSTVYFARLLDPKTDRLFLNEYINNILSLESQNQTDKNEKEKENELAEPVLFLLSRSSEILDDTHITYFFEICEKFLSDKHHNLQISASRALLVAYDAAPDRFDISIVYDKCIKHITKVHDTAVVLLFRLLATMTALLDKVLMQNLTNVILVMMKKRTAVTLLALKAMAFASGNKCHILFDPIWEPLLSLLGSKHETESLAFDAVGAAVVNCKLSDIEIPVNVIMNLIFSRPDLANLSFSFLALVRTEKVELNSLRPQIEELIKQTNVYSSLFQMLTVFNPLIFSKEVILPKLLSGIESSRPDVSAEAAICACSLIFALVESGDEADISFFRKPLINSVVKMLLEPRCLQGFDKRAEFMNEVFAMCNEAVSVEFVEALQRYGREPQSGFFDRFAEHLNLVKWSAFDFRISLRDFLLVIKKKAPFQMDMFFADDEGK